MREKDNDDELLTLIKEKLYTPVVGDILDQMGYCHQFLPSYIKPLETMVLYTDRTETDYRLKLAGYACTVLENDIFGQPKKPFGLLTEALDQLQPNEIYIATGAHNSALWGELLTATAKKEALWERCWMVTAVIPHRCFRRNSLFFVEQHGLRILLYAPTYVIIAAQLKSDR